MGNPEKTTYPKINIKKINVDTLPITTNTSKESFCSHYKIALLLPLSESSDTMDFNRMVSGIEDVPTGTQLAVDFLHGIQIALDSLSKEGFMADIALYNVLQSSDSSTIKLDTAMKPVKLSDMNLIIGPFNGNSFNTVGKFAAKHHIPIVSPLSGDNEVITDNPWCSKVTPSLYTGLEQLADYIALHYNNSNIIIVHPNQTNNDRYYQVFKRRLKSALKVFSPKDTVKSVNYSVSIAGFNNSFSRLKNNVVIVPYQEYSFVTKFVNEALPMPVLLMLILLFYAV